MNGANDSTVVWRLFAAAGFVANHAIVVWIVVVDTWSSVEWMEQDGVPDVKLSLEVRIINT